jgi:hypothetical protein
MAKCRLCGHNEKLIKAHIIPEAFFREARGEDKSPGLLFDDPDIFPKKSPSGVYNQEILCDQCESRFQLVDDHGAQVLLNRFHELFLSISLLFWQNSCGHKSR